MFDYLKLNFNAEMLRPKDGILSRQQMKYSSSGL